MAPLILGMQRAPRRFRPIVCVTGQHREMLKQVLDAFGVQPDHDLAVEDRRVRPACYCVSVSGQIMYRVFPYDTFLADARVADCYSRCRAEWKLNADVWGRAVRRICAGGREIEDANFGWRIGSSTPVKLAMFAVGWVKRRIRPPKLGAHGLATDGSWPNLGWYPQHSPTMKELWQTTPTATRELVARAWGENPWNSPLPSWSKSPNDLFRILTLASHLNRSSMAAR